MSINCQKVDLVFCSALEMQRSSCLALATPTAEKGPRRKLELLLALSRTPHGVIDMAMPAVAALLCLGHFPPLPVTLVGLITVFAGYTAVYALNDVVDLRTDKQKVGIGGYQDGENFIDGVLIRHPMAKGALSLQAGLAWTFLWAAVAMGGAYWLNPICLWIFLGGCILEGVYCLLWRVTPMRAIINGMVKSLGAMAAVFAVDPCPSFIFLTLLFLWIFSWEIGGQNIPNDWNDIEEDRHFRAKTIPVHLGTRRAGLIAVLSLVLTLFLNMALFWASPLIFNGWLLCAAIVANVALLLWPVRQLVENRERSKAMTLFNRASYYPLAMLCIVMISII
jgi:4-hydroxybenzoate polyprenyltransferase